MCTRALDRNFVLQKQLERSCKCLEREYKLSQRKVQSIAEGCVEFTYQLLQEATIKERESLKDKHIENKPKPRLYEEIKTHTNTDGNTKLRVRPQTAQAKHGTAKNRQTRPSSAHPLLSSETTQTNNQSNDDNKGYGATNRLCKVTQIVKQKRLKNISVNSSNDINNTTYVECDKETEIINIDVNQRPKTADFYRKKQPESELSIYWSRRIRAVISRWDQEDKEDIYVYNEPINKTSSKSRPLTPQIKQTVLTESEKRLQAFVRRYGSKYRTQMRPFTSTEALSKKDRTNYHLSKQELASIHAETSKRLKNTKMLVMKSRRIQQSIERFAGGTEEMNRGS